jgi:hypothetical protein
VRRLGPSTVYANATRPPNEKFISPLFLGSEIAATPVEKTHMACLDYIRRVVGFVVAPRLVCSFGLSAVPALLNRVDSCPSKRGFVCGLQQMPVESARAVSTPLPRGIRT